ncbi:MAG: hypothetical protein ACD_57C00031G0011 [uncultured bacterium]|uniref:Shikimate kinase n=1 Tax=Candidatus Curtissbacteria bacterium RIFOXYA1_FULL_41_14 TaxID=1797737 RepID=A0A1F5HAC0_9BACT|nr:MAG: hypothetical protein ACD_57C00031G0011 [uncultured bacterium]KKR60750.1 MAG: hypothetical protein UT99_C0008G0019 [Candidatus Curtissbacteria bacterium GW2011_GWA2_40_31]KKR61639.1 MAG: hypothetical protein UU00_C0010G0027 [Microgenomates group bacterium GW2011_GWC1_40_35]KKR64816.1 MAG: hypothetical protein UU05_C0038G0003 [Candidatus Curtissbacteria bacterium GW2011_GWA1_40_47]KKR77830.1 MAG: hypothetical protein UU19_C0002G0020 [Candidatus Curtissbacteria bacterium GW2011_GWD1_40_8]
MKAIVIGTSLSGKTTLIRYLRRTSNLPLLEVDEELTRLNNGIYPIDDEYKHTVLAPQIIKNILSRDNVVFFSNTDYFTFEDIKVARYNNFQIIQLSLDLKELQNRNKSRVEKDGYSDLSQWLEGMVNYQIQLKKAWLVDKVIDANQSTEDIAKELIEYLS